MGVGYNDGGSMVEMGYESNIKMRKEGLEPSSLAT